MNEEKQIVLKKIDKLISKRKAEMLKGFPSIHEIDDGIIVRFFTEWDNCADDEQIKWKKIDVPNNPDESVVFFYLPKGSAFELKQRFFIGCMTCLNGKIEVDVNGETVLLESYKKICVNSEDVKAKVFENTYLLTTSNKKVWSETTQEHVKEYQ